MGGDVESVRGGLAIEFDGRGGKSSVPDGNEEGKGLKDRPRTRDATGCGSGVQGGGAVADRVLIALIEPRALTRDSLSDLIERNMEEVNVLAVTTPHELLADHLSVLDDIQLIIFSIGGAQTGGEDFKRDLAVLNARLGSIPIVIMSDRSRSDDVAEAMRHGARGYIPTTLDSSVAIEAVRLVRAGGTYIPASAFLQMVTLKNELSSVNTLLATEPSSYADFTPRQADVLRLLQQGMSNKVIAKDLNMQESTVKVHVRQIMKKLRAANRTQAVINASLMLKAEAKT